MTQQKIDEKFMDSLLDIKILLMLAKHRQTGKEHDALVNAALEKVDELIGKPNPIPCYSCRANGHVLPCRCPRKPGTPCRECRCYISTEGTCDCGPGK